MTMSIEARRLKKKIAFLYKMMLDSVGQEIRWTAFCDKRQPFLPLFIFIYFVYLPYIIKLQ